MRALIAVTLLAAAGSASAGGIGLGIGGGLGGGYGGGHGGGYGGAIDYYEPRPYQYKYAVDDPHYGPMFEKAEESDGVGLTTGSYAVNLPDGRTQIVKYVADWLKGFNAEVSYAGVAAHPQVAPGYGIGGGTGGVGVGVVKKKVVAPVGLGYGGGYGR